MAHVWNKITPAQEEEIVVSRNGEVEFRQRIVEHARLARRQAASMISQVTWLLFAILEGLIILRIVLKLIAANPSNPFAGLIYGFTDLFLWPFYGLTWTPSYGGMVLEIPSVIALIVYGMASWVLVKIVWLCLYRPTTAEAGEMYDEDIR